MLKERLPGLLGGLEIVLDYVADDLALLEAHVKGFLVSDATPHVPTDFQQFKLEIFSIRLEIFEVFYDFRVRE